MPQQSDAIHGVLLGTMVGDAFGAPLEGSFGDDLSATVSKRASSKGVWGYTDDFAMTLAVANWLIASADRDPAVLLGELQKQYEPARGFGHGMKIALRAFALGVPWDQCASQAWPQGSRGYGSAVRIGPVACMMWPSRQAFHEATLRAAIVTHAHPEAIDATHLQAGAIRLILDEPAIATHPARFVSNLLASLPAISPWIEECLKAILDFVERNAKPVEVVRKFGCSPLACESVPAGIWAVLSRSGSFSEAICQAAELGGDVDSICAMTGALAGALHGVPGIPPMWLENLNREVPQPSDVAAMADRLARISNDGLGFRLIE